MHGHSYFFSLRRHLNINFSRDLNGSGTQGLFIKKQNVDIDLIKVIFDYTDNKNDDFLYEADLIKDQRKDGNDSNLLIVFYVQIMPDDFVMQLHRF